MTALMDDTLSAIGRQLSVAYVPTVLEPLPGELKDLVVQLVAFEVRKRGSSARPAEALQFVTAQLASDPRSTDPSVRRQPYQRGSAAGLGEQQSRSADSTRFLISGMRLRSRHAKSVKRLRPGAD